LLSFLRQRLENVGLMQLRIGAIIRLRHRHPRRRWRVIDAA
jgi:hypothetical protein